MYPEYSWMRGLVKEESEGGQTWVDIWDIGFNLSQIETAVRTAFMPMSSTVQGVWHFTLTTDEEEEQKKKKRERNYKRLENFRSGSIMGLKNRVNSRVEDLKNIQNIYLKPFEQKDDDYRKKVDGIYITCTSEKDKWKNFLESVFSVGTSFLKAFVIAAVTAFIVTVAPVWAVVAIVVVLGTGIAVMVNMPEETVPECLSGVKEFSDGVANEAVKVLKEGPVVLVEDIGQGFMDTIQTPEGIASVSGGILGGLAGGFAGSKVKAAYRGKLEDNLETVELNGYEYLDDQLGELKGKVKINQYQSAESVNEWWAEQGYDKPPYTPKTVVQDITLQEDVGFVRVYDGEVSGLKGGWVMRAEDIKGLTPSQIQDKFALPATPKYIGEVNLKTGNIIRMGEVNPNYGFSGGGIQFDLKGQYIGEFREIGDLTNWSLSK